MSPLSPSGDMGAARPDPHEVASRRLAQQEREWVARLERLIVDEIFPYRVDPVEHAKEMRLVAHMIMAGR